MSLSSGCNWFFLILELQLLTTLQFDTELKRKYYCIETFLLGEDIVSFHLFTSDLVFFQSDACHIAIQSMLSENDGEVRMQ